MIEYRQNPEGNVLSLNRRAMEKLRQSDYNEALECLNEAENILKLMPNNDQLWAITLNNYGCYYKKRGKLQDALSCLNQALEKEKKVAKDVINLAGTHLNISAIYSQLSVHETALNHASKALKLLQNTNDRSLNMWTTQIIAHHSSGLEYEALQRTLEALNMYKKGWELGKEKLGENHALTLSLKRSLMNLSNESYSSDGLTSKLSKLSIRKPKTSSSRISQRKTPLSVPPKPKKDSFPAINDNISFKENISGTSSEKPKKYRNIIHSADRYKNNTFIPTPPKKIIQPINKKKYDALKTLIDELEGNIPINDFDLHNHMNKPKAKIDIQKNFSKGIQVEMSNKKNNENIVIDIERGWRKYKKPQVNKNETIDLKVQEAHAKAKEAMREVERLKKEKEKITVEKVEKKELVPIPNRSKVDFYNKKESLQTIYESRYEDQLEPVILIQSHIKSWLARKKYNKLKKSAIQIQKAFRMYMIKSLYKNIKAAAIFIQSVYRGHRVRKLYYFLLNSN
jgi:tetratricopeptide (TPR) repeat protein